MDNSTSQNNNSGVTKSSKNIKNNDINTNFEIKINNNNTNNKNTNNNDLFNIININQIDYTTYSRNKKYYVSKLAKTHSQKEVNIKDIHIKSIKNLIERGDFISELDCLSWREELG